MPDHKRMQPKLEITLPRSGKERPTRMTRVGDESPGASGMLTDCTAIATGTGIGSRDRYRPWCELGTKVEQFTQQSGQSPYWLVARRPLHLK